MDRENAVEGEARARLASERQVSHGLHRVMQPDRRGEQPRTEGAVVGDALRHERMRELQQDGAAPPGQDDPLGIDAFGDVHANAVGDRLGGVAPASAWWGAASSSRFFGVMATGIACVQTR